MRASSLSARPASAASAPSSIASVSIEGFYKDLDQLAVAVPDALGSESGQRYDNVGVGRAYGGELLLRYKQMGRFFGWLAYTLSRSERRDTPDADWEDFDYDQTHIL